MISQDAGTSRTRSSHRRSAHAVGVGASRPVYTPSIEIDQPQGDDDYGMGY
ncbi:hypothetical protein SAZ11_07690 [Streptomyces sp. FXJ1.4098]|nr:hypothetical protein [Streptomyces sp. FXJ1.4098]